ncbi:MAG: PAS domain-containing protein [Burkholderiaceae bacterium]|nr:PAS domain-containing protein [Burkholderiaceae bacterium]
MRNNEPVTGREHRIPPNSTLMSTTDINGIITHCNGAFVEASGFSREELIGQPHNIIRHPDMPKAAFADLWATIKQGRSWSMLVKNRRKDGDHYWVQANVTPLMSNGKIEGFLSIRTAPDRLQQKQAEALYASFRSAELRGTALGQKISQGQVIRTGFWGATARFLSVAREGALTALPSLSVALVSASATAAGGLTVGVVAALLVAWIAARLQQRLLEIPLQASVNFARSIAAGDLAASLGEGGSPMVRQLQGALRQLRVNLHAMVGDTRGEVTSLERVIATVAAGKESLAAATDTQAAGLEQSAAALKQLTEAVRQNVHSAEQGADLAEKTLAVAKRSNASIDQMRATMQEISDSSERISSITQLIDTISFQTNILALNAAVEAARAGSQGRGFAVVAAEVRALANRTTEASREIKQLSQNAQDRVSAGVTEVVGAAAAISDTAAAATQLRSLVDDVHRSSKEQLQAISEITLAVDSLDDLTHKNTVLVQQLSNSADTLSHQAGTLSQSVKLFRTHS